MGGGSKPSAEQNAAAKSQAQLNAEMAAQARQNDAREQEQYDAVKPFAFDRLANGLPYKNVLLDYQAGAIPRAFAPARANLERGLASFGEGLPSGFASSARARLGADQARAYDDALVNVLGMDENAKAEAARLITNQQTIANPAQFYGLATQGNSSIYNSDALVRRSQGLGGLLGGAITSVAGKIPF